MNQIKHEGMFSVVQPGDSGMSLPFIYEDAGVLSLHFQIESIQSQMRVDRPEELVLSYTRTMMAFLLFNPYPETLVMIGLGGGSIAKWCYRHLPCSDITVVEINPHVIGLRDYFYIPRDDKRFRVLCEDGAVHVARTSDKIDVLIVDGFDADGQPPELCSEEFYNACYDALTFSGLMVVNLCGWGDRINIARIKKIFGDRVLVVTPDDGSNRVVFASKGQPLWHGEHPGSFLMKLKEFEYQWSCSGASPHCLR
jgi:spermidine synthase